MEHVKWKYTLQPASLAEGLIQKWIDGMLTGVIICMYCYLRCAYGIAIEEIQSAVHGEDIIVHI